MPKKTGAIICIADLPEDQRGAWIKVYDLIRLGLERRAAKEAEEAAATGDPATGPIRRKP